MSSPSSVRPSVLLVMGVSGVGKTTVGQAIAERLGWAFFDADDLHPSENVDKMARGEGLTDTDRLPWLKAVRGLIERRMHEEAPAVVACSALRASYRKRLRDGDTEVCIVWLDADPKTIRQRLQTREGHFAGADLLKSQIETLERPEAAEGVVRVSAEGEVGETVDRAIEAAGLGGA